MKVETPLFVPVLAALPVAACMAILGLPVFGYEYAAAFRSLYFVACLVWLIPLALLQRAMWRRDWPWLRMALVLLAASYAMSILNAVLGQGLGIWLGLQKHYRWNELAEGLDGCWLALIAFCAVHAVAAYYLSLQQVRLHLAQATRHTVDIDRKVPAPEKLSERNLREKIGAYRRVVEHVDETAEPMGGVSSEAVGSRYLADDPLRKSVRELEEVGRCGGSLAQSVEREPHQIRTRSSSDDRTCPDRE